MFDQMNVMGKRMDALQSRVEGRATQQSGAYQGPPPNYQDNRRGGRNFSNQNSQYSDNRRRDNSRVDNQRNGGYRSNGAVNQGRYQPGPDTTRQVKQDRAVGPNVHSDKE